MGLRGGVGFRGGFWGGLCGGLWGGLRGGVREGFVFWGRGGMRGRGWGRVCVLIELCSVKFDSVWFVNDE